MAFGESVAHGYARSKSNNSKFLLAVAILWMPLVVALGLRTIVFEWPLAISVTPQSIDFIYRISWRHQTIPMTSVSRVELQRKVGHQSGGFKYGYYTIVIDYDHATTQVSSDGSPSSNAQLEAAYRDIESMLPPQKRNPQ